MLLFRACPKGRKLVEEPSSLETKFIFEAKAKIGFPFLLSHDLHPTPNLTCKRSEARLLCKTE